MVLTGSMKILKECSRIICVMCICGVVCQAVAAKIVARIGFEKEEDTYALHIDKGISCSNKPCTGAV